MAKILAVAPFLFMMAPVVAVQTNLAAAHVKQELRLDASGSDTVGFKPHSTLKHNRSAQWAQCRADPVSCLHLVKCPALGAMIRRGCVPDPTNVSYKDVTQGLQDCTGNSADSAFLLSLDAAFIGPLNFFDLESNHIGTTNIRRERFADRHAPGRINETAFEFMWDNFHSTINGSDLMCIEDVVAAGKVFRKLETDRDPWLDFKSFVHWENTVYGTPEGRDVMTITLIALPLLFGDHYGETKCLTKSGLGDLYLRNTFPDGKTEFFSEGPQRFLAAGRAADGRISNAKWHIPTLRREWFRRVRDGTIPRDDYFSNLAQVVMWLA